MKYKFLRMSLLSAFAILFGGAALGALMGAETETIFSATVKATSDQSFSNGTTEITSDQATIAGGKMYAISGQSSAKNLIAAKSKVYYFSMTNNNTYFKVELDKALAVGDVITADALGGVKKDNDGNVTGTKGIWVSTSDSYPSEAPACAGTSETESIVEGILNYTITEGSEYVGKTTLYIYRAIGATEYFNNFKITRASSGDEGGSDEGGSDTAEFQDFEITNAQMSGEFDASTLPTGVTFSGTQRNDNHGYGAVTLKVPVTGSVKFTFGGCQYANQTFTVKNEAGETLETLDPHTEKCYHQDGSTITYEYKGEATTLTFATIQYLPYFKAEAIPEEPAEFQDFEITNAQMSGEFDASTLPTGVTFSGTQRNDNHGYGAVTLKVPVTGSVKFTFGGCQYANQTFTVKNEAGETLATLDPKTEKCYHQDGSSITYEYKGEATTLTFATIQYLPYFKAEAIKEEPHDPVILTWDYSEKDIPTESPADGLYFASYVNDAAGTNNGMHGVKLNSSGWAYFEKPAVAGKLTLTFGNRKSADAYEVNVSKGTLNADGKTATKGDLIGTVAVTESPGTGSIELPADVTGVYIDRKTGAEGVLQKIVFKETVARTFVDFEIPYATLTADGYTGAGLPTGVSFSGSFHDKQHGYQNATMVVPVDGTVKFTISGCQYGGSFPVKNATGETLATLDQKSAGCYDAGGTVTYFYIGNATTLTFGPIQYLSYFKAEATDVQEVTITYKDQNGNVLGKKTVFEGETLGEVPYTEADLTIPEGEKFRGWVYTSGVKVKTTDVVTGNVSVNASVTPIETAPETGSMQTYDLTKATFYPEDHENFNVEGGSYYNNHGFTFNAEGSFQVAVSSKAQIVLSLCQYGNGTTITVKDPSGNVIREDVPAKADTDGGTTAINYEGEAGMLTFTFAAQSYLHSVKVYNVSEFIEKDETSGYYIVPAGDAAGLVLALNQAASNPNSKIFLPNGTYDFGEAVLTGISGTNVSIIGQDADKTIIVNAPPVSMEGLEKADLFLNTSTGLYLQDVTLKNDLDYYTAGTGRAAVLHDKGTKTICKNVKMLSYQDTYYSHKVGGVYYFEGGEVHGTVDYMCGNGRVYFNEVKIVNEKRSSATMSANSELYVYNNCVVENNADAYNFGRAWSDHPVCIWLNTTLNDPDKLVNTRWNLTGINCDYSIAGEYGTKNASGTDITPESNTVTFTKENTTLNTILTADQAATYTMEYTLGEWAATAQAETKQVEAPSDAKLENGTITWTAAAGATAYAIFKDGELLGIVDAETTSFVVEDNEAATRRAEGAAPVYTIRVANGRGGFGEARTVTDATAIEKVKADEKTDWNNQMVYDLQGRRVKNASKGVFIINGHKVIIK